MSINNEVNNEEYNKVNEIYDNLKLKASIPGTTKEISQEISCGTYCEFKINYRSICYNEQNITDKTFRYFLPEGEDPKNIRELFIKKLDLRDEKYAFSDEDESYNLLINILYERGWFDTIKKELGQIYADSYPFVTTKNDKYAFTPDEEYKCYYLNDYDFINDHLYEWLNITSEINIYSGFPGDFIEE
jgi:hypothetical protein